MSSANVRVLTVEERRVAEAAKAKLLDHLRSTLCRVDMVNEHVQRLLEALPEAIGRIENGIPVQNDLFEGILLPSMKIVSNVGAGVYVSTEQLDLREDSLNSRA